MTTTAAVLSSAPTSATTQPTTATSTQTHTSSSQTQPTPASGEAAKLYKLKVDGQEFELPESELIALAQQGKSANKRFQEAASTKREAEQIVNFLKSNPKEAFKKLGIDVRKFSEDTLMEMITQDKMTPEQKQAHNNELELKKYRDGEKQAKDLKDSQAREALEKHHHDTYEKVFIQALTESGLPKTAYTVMRMAQLEQVNVSKKLNLTPTQLANVVREDFIAEQKALYGAADGNSLLDLLGPDAVKKLSKAQITKYKASGAIPKAANPGQTNGAGKEMSPAQAWKAMQKKTRSMF